MSRPTKNLLVDLWLIAALASRLVDEGLHDSVLSVDEFAVYGLISDLGAVTVADLSQWTGLPRTTLSNLLRRCEDRGELTRAPNPEDRRSWHLMLSEQGRAAYVDCLPGLGRALEELHDHLAASPLSVRLVLQDVDGALRGSLGAPPRPYSVDAAGDDGNRLDYAGEQLTERQRAEIHTFIDWVRARDS